MHNTQKHPISLFPRRPGRIGPAIGLIAILAAAPFLPACGPTLVVGAGASVGNAAMQERGFKKTMADTGTETKISANLLSHSADLFTGVSVEVYEGRVLLTGAVEKPADRIEAVKIAWQADGVTEVINEIQARDDSDLLDAARDRWITTKLGTLITFDKKIKGVNYSIETVNGKVYLIGIAQSQAELDRVINHARSIGYVRRVITHVRLKDQRQPGQGT
jgi:osmotically-inducible protein OsmY